MNNDSEDLNSVIDAPTILLGFIFYHLRRKHTGGRIYQFSRMKLTYSIRDGVVE